MKTFSVIVILSTLSLSHSLKCKVVDDWASSVTFAADKDCTNADDKCVRPVWDGTAYKTAADGALWGCGKCTTKKNCVECDTDNCNILPAFKCKTDVGGTDGAKPCSDIVATTDAYSTGATKCYRPKIVDLAGTYASDGATWGCAACAQPKNCAECTTSLCNVAPTAKHGCLTYSKTTGKFVKGASAQCSDDLNGCRMPTPDNAAATWDPCGPCADPADKTCQACDSADCNDLTGATVRYCKAGKADAALNTLVSNFCAADSDCKRPFISYGKPVTDASNYECGDCGAAKDKTCKNCGTKANDCNGAAWPTNTVKCFKWTWATDKYTISGAAGDCDSNDDTAKCSRPVFVAKEAGFKGMDGCGPCPAGSKDCKDFGAELNVAGSHECFLWDWNETDKKWKTSELQAQCDLSSDKKCSLPINRSTKEGFTSTGCGSCKTEEAKGCTTTEPGKNVAGSHQCYLWTWNDTDKKWKSSETLGECNSPSDKKCSLPKDRSAKDGFSGGCGSCKAAEEATCMTTDEGKNWGQRVTISLLAAVLPLLYVML